MLLDRFFLCMSINLSQSLYVNLGSFQVSTLPVTPGRVRSPGPVRRHYGAVSPVRRSPVQPGAVDKAVQRTLKARYSQALWHNIFLQCMGARATYPYAIKNQGKVSSFSALWSSQLMRVQ